MNSFADVISGKKVLVFGLGRQGGGAGDVDWLKQHGAQVKIIDKDPQLAPDAGSHQDIVWADLIIKNPAVPDDHELITYAMSLHKPVETSIAVFVKYSPIPAIGVTGTRGKSTTVALITAVLERAFPGAVLTGGNIPGTSGLSMFDLLKGKKYAVLELSSFQLHNFHERRISPHIAVVTNLYPDHLNRYQSMDSYRSDKEAIVAYQQRSDLCLFNADNPGARKIAQSAGGQISAYSAKDVATWQTALPGLHNRENIAAMWAVAKSLGIKAELAQQVVLDFHGLPHRLEKVREVEGVSYINDTTATTPTAAIKALESISAPIIWITGGDTKKLPFEDLLAQVKQNAHLKQIVILGSHNIPDYTAALAKIAPDKIIGTANSMIEAVDLAAHNALPGDTILLSPGFTSFDLFKNEFDRGNQFRDAVNNL